MHFQALLLFLVIIISFFLNTAKNNVFSGTKSDDSATSSEKFVSVFINDFYSAASGKLAFANNRVKQNLTGLKRILFEEREELFLKLSPETDSSANTNNGESAILISRRRIDPLLPVCDFNKTVFTARAILTKYPDYNSSFFELNPEKRWPIASLTKLMTSVIAVEKIGADKEITISEKAFFTEGATGNLETGEVYKIDDLIKAMLISSSNDAAAAIAESFGEKKFIDEMQKKAAELKMFQTTYLEPTGLSYINQSTVNDLAKLINYIYKNYSGLLEISRQKEIKTTDLKTKKQKTLFSVNKFAGELDFIGGKTGYIEESGRNMVGLFNIAGKTVLTIVLGAENSFEETTKLKDFVQKCISPTLF